MTDAAVPVTQSAVENFTAVYLRSIGCEIDIRDDKWKISIPEDVETDLPKGEYVLLCDTLEESDGVQELLHPESEFFQTVLDDASNRAPLGGIRIDATNADIIVPDWLQESSVSVSDIDFTPYYDRSALVVLFRVSVETVSEYQQEFLRSIGMDIRSKEVLPNIDKTFLTMTQPEAATESSKEIAVNSKEVERMVDASREPLLSDIESEINEIHREASRAADAELEEYRQLQRQREDELEKETAHLRSKIEKLNELIDEENQTKRVEALKERRECKSALQEVEAELKEARLRRERGYPDQQRKIRDRHGLDVVVTPVTVTEVEYERGDAEIIMHDGGSMVSLTVGYGSGLGVTEEVDCDTCGRSLSVENPLGSITNGIRCTVCNGD